MVTPAEVATEFKELHDAAEAVVPAPGPSNLLIGTWNLRGFGNVTPSWEARPSDSPKRDWRAVALIAAVIGCFDIMAVQEVRRDTTALRFLLDQLGPDWRAIVSDVNEGDAGNDERLTFLYNTTRVQPSGLVGEIVLPAVAGTPAQQFARSPYAVGFVRDGVELILATVHIMWGDKAGDRLPEVSAFAQWMRAWADRKGDWNKNLLVLGDFNLDRLGDPLYDAFVSTGLWPPTVLNDVPRTIFDNDRDRHFYDQIAWFDNEVATAKGHKPGSLLSGLAFTGNGGTVDFLPHVFRGLTKTEVSWRISDHYPLWVDFALA
ncbi:MAG: endonuclease/exonuclease/phosphatase family protein [Actinomycetia bacterium]|nr:endonuclease/exonuclease/phosphatase family protein [Actinomycetes bacterium]